MNLSYGALHDSTPDRIPEGSIEGDPRVTLISVQHQVEGADSRMAVAFLPVLQSVSPETPEFRGARCDFEPVMTNEEEVVRPLL